MAELWEPVPLPQEPEPPARVVRVRRRPRPATLIGWALLGLAALTLVTFVWITRTDRGATLVVSNVLRRLPIRGEITARRARSDRLLQGVRLYDVSVRGTDGRLFLLADSVRLAYSWRTLVSGDVVFDTVDLWRPSVMVTRYPRESEFNAQRIFVSEEEALDTARAPLKNIAFYGVAIHAGELRVLYPGVAEPGSRLVTGPAPVAGDSVLVRHTFAGIDARLPSVILQSPDSTGQRIAVDSLAVLAEVLEDPVRVRHAAGQVRVLEQRMDVALDQVALDHSDARGSAFVEFARPGNPLHYGIDLQTPGLELADLAWIDPRIGEGRAVGGARLDVHGPDLRTDFRTLRVSSKESRVQLNGGLAVVHDRFRFQKLDVRATPLALARVQPWLARPLPVQGTVEGAARLDGTLEQLATSGNLTLRRPGSDQGPVSAEFDGTFHLSERPGAGVGFTDLHATLDPFDFGLLGELEPGVKLRGPGRVELTATGRTTDAITFHADVRHRPAGLPASSVVTEGTVRKRGQLWVLDVAANLQPLSLTALAQDYPDLPLTGNVTGRVNAHGLLSDLTLETDLTTEAGKLAVTARVDAEHPGQHYAVQGEVAQFALSRLDPDLPSPTTVTGYVNLEGRGTDPATLTLDARARLRRSRVGGLFVDTASLAVRARRGTLSVDTVTGVFGGVAVQGSGTLALRRDLPPGTLELAFQSDSLGRLRPLAFGDVVIARDTLSELDRELLRAEGVDPDTLPTRADVELSGAVQGNVTLTGSVQDFAARGRARFGRVRFARSTVEGATVDFEGAGLPESTGRMAATVEADSLNVRGRAFAGARAQIEYTRPRGHVDVQLRRRGDEDYTARAGFELHQGSGRVDLEQMALRFDSVTWALERPSTVAWDREGVRIQELVLSSRAEGMRVEANGLVPRSGAADLAVQVQGLRLERVARLLQREQLGIRGRLDLETRITGTGAAPIITGRFDATDLDFESFSLTRFGGRIDYADRTARVDLGAWERDRRVLTATGQVPVDLAFADVARRVPPDRQMDLSVVADSLPAALALGYFTLLTDVDGAVSGRFHVGGTVNNPTPSGTLTMLGAAFSLEDLGVRLFDVRGNLQLREDGVVEAAVAGNSGVGVITTAGTINLHPLTDPTFNLLIGTQTFLAVQRPDITGTVSGSVTLTGTYSRPVITSLEGYPVRIDEGVIYVEEFQRTISVVDLADPTFFSVVDTTLANARPLLAASANPFLRNMRVTVDLTAERNAWLRGEEINIEMAGDLQMQYDRQSQYLVMIGALQAIRGTYAILGRRFDVQSGTVRFVGTQGINPQLNITATTTVRPQGGGAPGGGDKLTITATVTGTLVEPRVALTSQDGAISQSDLVSYLVFGVPSYQLGSAQQRVLGRAAPSFVGTAVGAGVSYGLGTVVNQLSTFVAREWSVLDYFAINQGQYKLDKRDLGFASSLYDTTLEFGLYLEEDVFLTFLLRPLANRGTTSSSTGPFAGARIDWQLPHSFTAQAFYQLQDIPQGTASLGAQQIQAKMIPGLSIFRDWGYGRRGPPPPSAPAPTTPRVGSAASYLRPAWIAFGARPDRAASPAIGIRWRRIPPVQ